MEPRVSVAFYRYSLKNRGGDRMVIEYANYLAEQGHAVTIHTALLDTVFNLSPKLTVKKIPWPGRLGFLAYTLVHKLDYGLVIADIIHLTPLLRSTGRLVYFAQADDVEYYGGALQRNLVDVLYRRFFRRGGTCVAVYDHLTEMFRKRYGALSFTVVNGIDRETFYPEPDEQLIAQKEGRKAIFFMARGDHYRKGIDLGLQVFERLAQAHSNQIELWVCGDELPDDYAFPVRQFGTVSDGRLRQILSSADFFFYPSRHEGFGLFPLEAMACGCVAVTTDAIPYAHRYACIHVAPVGEVESMVALFSRLLGDEERMSEDRAAGYEVAAKYDLKKSKVVFADVLQTIVEQPCG